MRLSSKVLSWILYDKQSSAELNKLYSVIRNSRNDGCTVAPVATQKLYERKYEDRQNSSYQPRLNHPVTVPSPCTLLHDPHLTIVVAATSTMCPNLKRVLEPCLVV